MCDCFRVVVFQLPVHPVFLHVPHVHHPLPASLCLITIITRAPAREQVSLDAGDWWVGNLKIIDTNRCST